MSDGHKSIDVSLGKAVGIVAAYVSNNSLRASDLPELIASVHASVVRLSKGDLPSAAVVPEAPAVPIKKSVTKDYIVCLEDGKKFKSLRRHLSSSHNMTPEQYRTKWSLPSDHPMVAPSYSATRSQLAKDSGLGHVGKEADPDDAVPAEAAKPESETKPEAAKPETETNPEAESKTEADSKTEGKTEPVTKAKRGRPKKIS